jgi:PAS domain S-box-containing protein
VTGTKGKSLPLDAVPHPVVAVSPADLSIVDANRAIELAAGWTRRELLGRVLPDLLSLPSGVSIFDLAARATTGGDLTECGEVELRRADGGILPCIGEIWPPVVLDRDEAILLVLIAGDAVTGIRARTPEDSRFKALIHSIFDAYYDWHIRSGYNEFSEQMDSLLGLQPGEFPRTFAAWADRLHPDDRRRAVSNVVRSTHEGGIYADEYRLRRRDGSYALVADRGLILQDRAGHATHMVGVIRDVTQQREAERTLQESAELYQTLFVNAANPAYQIDEAGRYVDANEAGIAFLKTTRQRLLQQSVREHIGDAALDALQAATVRGPTRVEVTVDVDSELKTLILTVVPCQVGGQPMYFALGTDVTEDRQLRRALQESEESLRRQAVALEESNTALRVILEQRTRDRDDLARTMLGNIEQMILPMLGRLERPLADTPEIIYLDAVGQTLRDVLQPIAQSLDGSLDSCPVPLTPREREIANLIRTGKSTDAIAAALYISPDTVAFHRKNLRRKLGLGPGDPRLASHLARLTTGSPTT